MAELAELSGGFLEKFINILYKNHKIRTFVR